MTPQLENSILGSDVDFQNHAFRNIGEILPVPSGLVSSNDPRLSDQRNVTNQSVTNDSVADTAGIVQSKLSLTETMPAAWIGSAIQQAAQGDLVERVANKGNASGYAPLNIDGKLPVAYLPSTGPQAGTVTYVDLKTVPEWDVTGGPVLVTGALGVTWKNVPDNSWFGAQVAGAPSFLTKKLPIGLIPSLSAAKFSTGIFALPRLPVAIGIGVNHATGMVPDPGDGSKGSGTDYLGRDMTYKHFDSDLSYQPTLNNVNIFLNTYLSPTTAYVTIRSMVPGSELFYMVSPNTTFKHLESTNPNDVHITIMANVGDKINAYSAKAGYNNSNIAAYTVPPP